MCSPFLLLGHGWRGEGWSEANGLLDKVFTLLRAFPQDEPTRKKFVGEAVAWSARMGEFENGDPELHHVAGTVYAEGLYWFDEDWGIG